MSFDRVYPVYYEISFELETENELRLVKLGKYYFADLRMNDISSKLFSSRLV
jgi:hypothetical protein